MIVTVGRIQVNLKEVDGISFTSFKEAFSPHYKLFAKDKVDKQIKADYAELKKHFTKKKRG